MHSIHIKLVAVNIMTIGKSINRLNVKTNDYEIYFKSYS